MKYCCQERVNASHLNTPQIARGSFCTVYYDYWRKKKVGRGTFLSAISQKRKLRRGKKTSIRVKKIRLIFFVTTDSRRRTRFRGYRETHNENTTAILEIQRERRGKHATRGIQELELRTQWDVRWEDKKVTQVSVLYHKVESTYKVQSTSLLNSISHFKFMLLLHSITWSILVLHWYYKTSSKKKKISTNKVVGRLPSSITISLNTPYV